MSNLDKFGEVLGAKLSQYGLLPHFLNTTAEDCMCAHGFWLDDLLGRARALDHGERAVIIAASN